MHRRTLTQLSTLGLVASIGSTALAQTTQGALQIGLGTDFVSHTKYSGTWKLPGENIDSERKTTHWGFSTRQNVYIEGGYGIGDSIVVGGFLALGGWDQSIRENTVQLDENHWSNFDLLIAPKFDYMFLPDSRIRPFLGAAIGLAYHSEALEHTNNQGVTATRDDLSLTGLLLMGRAGIHAFITPGFSLDPAFYFGWVPVASGSRQTPQDPQNRAERFDFDTHGFTVGLSLTASGWVGL